MNRGSCGHAWTEQSGAQCPVCPPIGGAYPQDWRQSLIPAPPPRPCEHCYCIDVPASLVVPGKPHKQCCNCGNRQLVVSA